MRRTPLSRRRPLRASTPLQRRVPLRSRQSDGERVVAVGAEPELARIRRRRASRTGPDRATCLLVDRRSGRVCEWPGCGQPQTDRHHRLNRKQGGRHGEAVVRVNGAAWLLGACRTHHAYVTSPHTERLIVARANGWVLREHEDATQVPVLTCHDPYRVWLSNDGQVHRFEEGAA